MEARSQKELLLLLLFTSWCPSCRAELPELEKLHKEFGQRLSIFGLQLDDQKPMTASFPISHNLRLNEEIAGKIYHAIHAPASRPIPVLVLFKEGRYQIHYIGAVPVEMLKIDIQRAIGE